MLRSVVLLIRRHTHNINIIFHSIGNGTAADERIVLQLTPVGTIYYNIIVVESFGSHDVL